MNATRLLDAFAGLRVLVLGDAMLDVYLRGTSGRLCQEGPVPIVEVLDRSLSAGGAANTALNLRALGARVTLLSAIGDDDAGCRLADLLETEGVETGSLLRLASRATLCKQRIVAGSQLVVRVDQGDTGQLPSGEQRALAEQLVRFWPQFDAVVLSDYDYGGIGQEVIRAIAQLSRRPGPILVGDSKCLNRFAGVRFSAVKPNYCQAVALAGARPVADARRIDQVLGLRHALTQAVDAQAGAVTLDRDGAIVFESGQRPLRTFTRPNLQSRAAGAGDTYVAALTLALAAGAGVPQAAEVAAAAAAVVVARDGTSCCTRSELAAQLMGLAESETGVAGLLQRLEARRRLGERIVLTNGCFDILHRGHVTYLQQARALGDVLVVGLNSDASIARLKGPQRPVNSLPDRIQVLSALSCVDYVVPFEEDTPHRLIKSIRPDVFVKGGDYTRDRLPEAALVEELGGRVEILPLVLDKSTTRIIARIREAPPVKERPSARNISVFPPAALEAS